MSTGTRNLPPTADRTCPEQQDARGTSFVKSVERVRDLGEVFTPDKMVSAMLDLLPDEMWQPHPAKTFLEPAAGDGNFLVAILARKLNAVAAAWRSANLPAGDDVNALAIHGLEALSSVYGVDISAENIVGGVPGHEVGARDRVLSKFRVWFEDTTGTRPTSDPVLAATAWIVERNVLVGNMLAVDANGQPSGREELPLVEYQWTPEANQVHMTLTTLGQAESKARVLTSGEPTLFDGDIQPTIEWSGRPLDLPDAPIDAPLVLDGPAYNGLKRS